MLRVEQYEILTNQPVYENQYIQILQCVNVQTQQRFQANVINKSVIKNDEQFLLEVLKILKEEYHMNIVKVYEIVQNNSNIFVIIECFEQNLEQYLRSPQNCSANIYDIITQIIQGYKHLQRFQIIMRNLGLFSIFVKYVQGKPLFKIVDFSFSHIIGQKVSRIPESIYTAPEIIKSQPANDQCDIYSLGIILYQLCFQEYSYLIENKDQMREFHSKIKLNQLQCSQNNKIDKFFKLLLKEMLVYEQDQRINWQKLDIQPQFNQKFLIWQDQYLIDFTNKISQCQQEVTYVAINLQTQEPLDAKAFSTTETIKNRKKEIYEKLKGHQNENIIQIKEVICDQYFCYFVLEKGTMSLDEYLKIKDLNNDEIINFARQIIHGFNFLKSKYIIHHDLNLDNIVVKIDEHGKVVYKIANFGTEKSLNIKEINFLTSAMFRAPELFFLGCDDSNCEVFSFGLILYFIIEKKHYFKLTNIDELIKAQENLLHNSIQCSQCWEPRLRELIPLMVCYDQNSRINWEMLKSSPLFSSISNERSFKEHSNLASDSNKELKLIVAQQQNNQIEKIQNLNCQPNPEKLFKSLSEDFFLNNDLLSNDLNQFDSINLQQQHIIQQTQISQKNENENRIDDYIIELIDCSINLLAEFQNFYYMKDLGFTQQVLQYNQILIQLCFTKCQELEKLLDNQTVTINGFSFDLSHLTDEQKQVQGKKLDKILQSLICIANEHQRIQIKIQCDLNEKLAKNENSFDLFSDLSLEYCIPNQNQTKDENIEYQSNYKKNIKNLFDDFLIENPLKWTLDNVNPIKLPNQQIKQLQYDN